MELLILPGTLDNLGKVRKYIKSAAAEAGLEKKASYKLCLAVDEIVTNIITHGYNEAGLSGDIRIQAEIDEESLTINIEDTGKHYDPTDPDILEEETLTTQKTLEERSIGRLGIFLIYESVDKFIYEKLNPGNRNILVVNKTTK
ncbi:ATP-binding protein [Okeania sp.]|uniref:ATP-binding protein n=1 Tax=Okeania sp. TaxID=3100323 RepID=UPI002B4B84CB|nr:ATP-binding protein [Okeania sp.]MEB3340998.1 ATP-binding protein [Okeania sp.]